MAERRDEIDARVACITFAEPGWLSGFERKMRLPYPIYGDPERSTYEAFGFERGSAARVWLDPRVWWRYVTLMARGRRLPASQRGQDTLQLGGDALLDAAGRLRWIHRSRGPADRPSVDELVSAVRSHTSEGRGSTGGSLRGPPGRSAS